MNIKIPEIPNRLSEIDHFYNKYIERLLPTLAKIDLNKISDTSGLTRNNSGLNLSIKPVHYEFAELNIFISKKQLIISFAESEQYEIHHENNSNDLDIETIDKYLTGIRIIEYYNRKKKVIKRKYFYKDNTIIGTSILFPFYFRKLEEKEINITFKK